MPSIVYVAGARPNFMKIAPILKAAKDGPFKSILVHTGQHYDHAMSGVFFEQLGIPDPDVHLEVGSATHGVQTGRIMASFEEYVLGLADRPRGIVVVGDVNSTMACALVGAKLGIPVAHVEAGLRSFDRTMPEEINRIVTDQVSDLLLVSEPSGLVNLEREGIPNGRVHYVGNVMIDTLVEQLPAARALEMPGTFGLLRGKFAIATLHRPSNVDDTRRRQEHLEFLGSVAERLPVLFPAHPRTRALLGNRRLPAGVLLCDPLGYREFLSLVDASRIVVTDSGGVQEETTFLGIPCLTLRDTTERPVTVTQGTNVLVGNDIHRAVGMLDEMLAGGAAIRRPIEGWDGRASERIVAALTRYHD